MGKFCLKISTFTSTLTTQTHSIAKCWASSTLVACSKVTTSFASINLPHRRASSCCRSSIALMDHRVFHNPFSSPTVSPLREGITSPSFVGTSPMAPDNVFTSRGVSPTSVDTLPAMTGSLHYSHEGSTIVASLLAPNNMLGPWSMPHASEPAISYHGNMCSW